MSNLYLKVGDTVSGKKGQVFFDINNKRIEVCGIQKIETFDEISEITFSTVGTLKKQSKITGVLGRGKMTINYYAVKIFAEIMSNYRRKGVNPEFSIVIINNDPATSLGERYVQFTNVSLIGKVPLAKLDGTTDQGLTIDVDFRYEDFVILDEFGDVQEVGRE